MEGIEKYYRFEALEYSRIHTEDAELKEMHSPYARMLSWSLSAIFICLLLWGVFFLIPHSQRIEIACASGVESLTAAEPGLRKAVISLDGATSSVSLASVPVYGAPPVRSYIYTLHPFQPKLCTHSGALVSAVLFKY